MVKSKSKRDQYSFELNRDILGSAKYSPTKDDHKDSHADVQVPGNVSMNNLISNLLKRPNKQPDRPFGDLIFKK